MWKASWVDALDKWDSGERTFRVCKDRGRGMLITGTDLWKNYKVTSEIAIQRVKTGGLAARVQGLNRYYGLVINASNKLQLIKVINEPKVLKEIDFDLEYYKDYKLSLKVEDNKLSGYLDNKVVLEFTDNSDVLENGAMGLIVEDGTMVTDEVIVE